MKIMSKQDELTLTDGERQQILEFAGYKQGEITYERGIKAWGWFDPSGEPVIRVKGDTLPDVTDMTWLFKWLKTKCFCQVSGPYTYDDGYEGIAALREPRTHLCGEKVAVSNKDAGEALARAVLGIINKRC